jgi:ubiquinone/menaquinone biosynthesis C-methylase UbiE
MSHKGHAFPASQAWMLDNWIRRILQPPFELVKKLAITPEDTVLDFGCGPGYYLPEIAKRAKTVIAVDISPEMLAKAQAKVAKTKAKNVQFIQTDGKNVQVPDNSVDKMLLVTVYHEIGENETALKEFHRILKADGKLVVVEIIKKGLLPGGPIQNPDTLKKEIEAGGFKLEQMQPYKLFGIFFFTNAKNP